MKRAVFFILMLFVTLILSGQNTRKYEVAGNKAFEEQNYAAAVEFYSVVVKTKPSPPVAWKLAEAARMNRDYPVAAKWYQYVAEQNSKSYPFAWFWLGYVQKSMGMYQKASTNFRNSYNILKNQNSYYEKKSKHEISACEKALFLTFDPVTEKYEPIDSVFSSEYSEFQMLQVNDSTRWMTVLRPTDSPDTLNIISRAIQYSQVQSEWRKTDFFNSRVNVPGSHISSMTMDTTLKIIIFSVCDAQKGRFNCNLWQMPVTSDTNVFPRPLSLQINSSEYSTTHPHFARTQDRLYLLFSSDRPGGEGNYDIWISAVDENGNPGIPYNAGKTINTIDDEVSPFYDTYSKTLYFSSENYNSLGGLDLFKIQTDFSRWGFVENLGFPVNSSFHDLFYTHSLHNDVAFYSSNRPLNPSNPSPGCCNNIYYRDLPKQTDSTIYVQRVETIVKKTRQLIPLNLFFHNDEPNPRTWDTTTTLSYEDCFNSYTTLTPEYINEWKKPLTGDAALLAERQIESFFIDSVENNFNKFKLFADYMCELLDKGKNIEITIKGFASPLNTSDYNANLSKRRIESLVVFLMKYRDGHLVPYIEGTAEAGNRLIIHRQAFGKEKAASYVSGDIKDLRNSVYNPAAANERKVAIIAVEL